MGYIIKRLILVIPTLFLSLLLTFLLGRCSDLDPAERLLPTEGAGGRTISASARLNTLKTLRAKMGLDKPLFYVALSSFSEPDTLYKIDETRKRNYLSRLVDVFPNWDAVVAYDRALTQLGEEISLVSTKLTDDTTFLVSSQGIYEQLAYNYAPSEISSLLLQ